MNRARPIQLLFWLIVFSIPGQAFAQASKKYTRNPHGPIGIPCEDCHTNTSWKPIRSIPEFNHDRTGYPLRGLHTKVDCKQCHTNLVFKDTSTRCADCHADIHRRQFGANCAECHTVKGWEAQTQQLKQHENRFPLLGAHALLQCVDCHKAEATGQFSGLSTTCLSCHIGNFQKASDPDHKALGFTTTCESCHTMDTWFGAQFDHVKFTGFALTGMHATLECTACHIGGKFKGTPADCYSCHVKDYNGTANPNHKQAGLPTDCSLCHTTASWAGASFDHSRFTKFPLTGAHVTVPCSQCHINGQFAGTPTDCFSCHVKDFNGTTNPNHVQAGFPHDCSICHSTASWAGARFDHSKTPFPLTGAHVTVACSQCHVNGQFAGTPTDCYSCHVKDFNGTTNPNHVQAGFPHACSVCHNTSSWAGAVFDHSKTPFPLTGAHVSVACNSCHIGGVFAGTPTDCASCHIKDYNGTANPNHKQAGFPTDCSLCHNTASWAGASFDHNRFTKFPLTGAHVNVPCSQCHINGQFAGTPTDCFSCHVKDFNGTTNPNHKQAGLPTDCSLCHTTASWAGASFDHSRFTKFPLTGAHVTVPCSQCHINGQFAGTPTDCFSCHVKDFNGTTNPNHVQAGFPHDCSICHSTASWAGARFDHSKTPFPLTGAHVTVACSQCHVNGQFAGTPTDCYSCHVKDFNGTTNPNHVQAGFPHACSVCHNTSSWAGAVFDHSKTPFPLTGAHVNVACNSCHIGGVFAGTPTDCYSCHKTDYQGTTDPNHTAAGFPTTCQTCHTTTTWLGATFNHTWFQIPHHTAKLCSDCHTNPSNYAVFVCTSCHTKAQTDPKHQGVQGYVYNSANCYQCHKNGGGGD